MLFMSYDGRLCFGVAETAKSKMASSLIDNEEVLAESLLVTFCYTMK